jgi:XrtJ-associated TM-motif-TM protein
MTPQSTARKRNVDEESVCWKKDLEDSMNLNKRAFVLRLACILAMALPLRAQSGCVDSPEDPTIVLALVSGAGALAAAVWRARKR